MGTIKIFTGVMALTTAAVITVRGVADIRAGIQIVRDEGVKLIELAHLLKAVGEVGEKVNLLQGSSDVY